MRCPKCGYISFDHLDVCGKCKKDLSVVMAEIGGSTYAAEAPRFLVVQAKSDEIAEDFGSVESVEATDEIAFDEDFEDADLDVLVDDGDADLELDGPEILMDDDTDTAFDAELPEADEAEDFSFDESDAEETTESDITLSIPDELADMSDLSGPEESAGVDIAFDEESVAVPAASAGDGAQDIDLDDLNMELDPLIELDVEKDSGAADFEVALDDIDFSEIVPETAEKSASDDPLDMDSELDFELDLCGLTLHKDK